MPERGLLKEVFLSSMIHDLENRSVLLCTEPKVLLRLIRRYETAYTAWFEGGARG